MVSMNGAIADFGRQLRPTGAFLAGRLRRLVTLWSTRLSERRALAEMDDRLLRDIGVDRLDARREADRPFWEGGERLGRGRWS